jgi:hypothetical protein
MYRKSGEPPTSGTSKIANAEPAPDDGQIGEWPRKRLVEMDKRFRRAFRRSAIVLHAEPRPAPSRR